ncbi:MAG: hypothetical protein WDN67_00615 [Candidatus Moraniibacteriota bacterium]
MLFEAEPIIPKDNVAPSGTQRVNFRELSVGAGANIFKANSEGIFVGADNFTDAPFKVDYEGNLSASSAIITGEIQGATIKNAAGDILIDSTGLNSSNNFSQSTIASTSTQTTGSSSYVNVPGGSMNPFTLTRSTVVLISIFLRGWNDNYVDTDGTEGSFSSNHSDFQLLDSVNGSLTNQAFTGIPYIRLDDDFFPDAVGVTDQIIAHTEPFLLSAGSHTLTLQFKSQDGNGTTVINAFVISRTILGI